jgi:hypothetical protein
MCVGCVEGIPELQSHVDTSCLGYSDIRERCDLTTDDGLLAFYREVIKRRGEKE